MPTFLLSLLHPWRGHGALHGAHPLDEMLADLSMGLSYYNECYGVRGKEEELTRKMKK